MIPNQKAFAGGLAGLITWALCLGASHFGVTLDPSIQTLLCGAIGTLVTKVTPPSQRDIIRHLNDKIVAMAAADPSIPVNPTTKPRA